MAAAGFLSILAARWELASRVDQAALPEVSVTAEKQHLVGRTRDGF
jgi:hypothetical protein